MKFKIIFTTILFLSFFSVVKASWTPPELSPFFCPANDPACSAPLNTSISPQIKVGSFGLDNLRVGGNLFASRIGVGPKFINGVLYPTDIPSGASIDVAGRVKFRYGCSLGDCNNKVLTATDNRGSAIWKDYYWKLISPANIDLYNTNSSGKVGIGTLAGDTLTAQLTVDGAVSKYSSTLYGTNRGTHVNIGNSSISGPVSGSDPSYITISGGVTNTAEGGSTVISGGQSNRVRPGGSNNSVITGGASNDIGCTAGTCVAGDSSVSSVILGGANNVITDSDYSLAAGRYMRLSSTVNNSFVFGVNSSLFSVPNGAGQSNLFLIHPDETTDASGRVGIGTSTPTAKLDVSGKMVTSSLEVNGAVRIADGTQGASKILRSTDTLGNAQWGDPPAIKNGASVMHLRHFSDGGNPPTCPSNWTHGKGLSERVGNTHSNYVTSCYQDTLRCQVIEIKRHISGTITNIMDPIYEGVTYDPPACPAGFSAATTTTAHAGMFIPIYANRIRVCYKCY